LCCVTDDSSGIVQVWGRLAPAWMWSTVKPKSLRNLNVRVYEVPVRFIWPIAALKVDREDEVEDKEALERARFMAPTTEGQSKGIVHKRYLTVLTEVVRFSSEPVSWALAVSFGCNNAGTTMLQKNQLEERGRRFSQLAYDLLDLVPDKHLYLTLAGQPTGGLDGAALELAFENQDITFTAHPRCDQFLKTLWFAASEQFADKVHREFSHAAPPVPTWHSFWPHPPRELVRLVTSYRRFILTPMTLMFLETVFFICYAALCFFVGSEQGESSDHELFATTESLEKLTFSEKWFVGFGFSFLLYEVEQAMGELQVY
jgi:hypothetical protein